LYVSGGWGTIEYGTLEVAGQVEGGRWKPAHYWLRNSLFTDRIISCGKGSADNVLCFVRNDIYAGVSGHIVIDAIDLTTGQRTNHYRTNPFTLPGGPGSIRWFSDVPAVANVNNTVLLASFVDSAPSGTVLAQNTVLLTTPQYLTLSKTRVTATVSSGVRPDASVDIYLSVEGAAALWVTLTTQAQGRFSDNGFVMADDLVIQFLPFGPLDVALLKKTLRVETANDYASSSTVQQHVVME